MKRRRGAAADEDNLDDTSPSPSHPLERGLMGGLEREWRGGWARWTVAAKISDGTIVLEPGRESLWAVCRPTRGLEAPLREQVRASLRSRASGEREREGEGGPGGAVEHVSLGRGSEKRVVAAVKMPQPTTKKELQFSLDAVVSAARQWTAAEETAVVVARVVRPHVAGEAWAPWLQQHGDEVLAALNPRPVAAALATWARLRHVTQPPPGAAGVREPPSQSRGPVPFYVNRSKRQLDKAGQFTAGLAARLVELTEQASGSLSGSFGGSGREAPAAGGAGGAGGGGTVAVADGGDGGDSPAQPTRGDACPQLVAQLDGWQLEVICRVQAPQDELHVCVKLTEHPDLAAAAAAQARERERERAPATPAAAAADAERDLTSLQPSVGGCMAHLAGCHRGPICVLVSKLSVPPGSITPPGSVATVAQRAASPSTSSTPSSFTPNSSSSSSSVALTAVRAAARSLAEMHTLMGCGGGGGGGCPSAVVEVTQMEHIVETASRVGSPWSAVVCDAAVEFAGRAAGAAGGPGAEEAAEGETFIEGLIASSARALAPGGCLVLLVLQAMAGSVHRAMNKTREEDTGEVWSAHSTHRASLPTLKSGVKDVAVVLFRIERGAAPPAPVARRS